MGIGRYSVLFMGVNDGKAPSEPLEPSASNELLFVRERQRDLLVDGSFHYEVVDRLLEQTHALVLSRLAGATWVEALELANAAAGIAVGKRGTSTVTTDKLFDRFPKE